MDLEQAWKQVQQGAIRDGKTILAIQWLLLEKMGFTDFSLLNTSDEI